AFRRAVGGRLTVGRRAGCGGCLVLSWARRLPLSQHTLLSRSRLRTDHGPAVRGGLVVSSGYAVLLLHVRDGHVQELSARRADLESPARVVGVNMDFNELAVADHQEAIAQRLEGRLDLIQVQVPSPDQEFGTIAV